jgi:hypothetical protein
VNFILVGLIISYIAGSKFIVDAMLNSLIPMAFYTEQYLQVALEIGGGGHTLDFTGLYELFFGFGISLIVLKFLKKGFDVYVGWSDGDPDTDPLALVTNFLRALAVAMAFPVLYDLLVTVTSDLIDQAIVIVDTLGEDASLIEQLILFIEDSLFLAIAGLVFIVVLVLLWVQFMMRGVEMMVMRVGMPVACLGLIDSDKGIFAPYAKKFFMNAFTVLIQILLVKIALSVMVLGNPFLALAMLFVAMRTPRFLSEFMLAAGGAGHAGVNTIYHTSRMYQMVRGALRR